jgi:hypothetical protein
MAWSLIATGPFYLLNEGCGTQIKSPAVRESAGPGAKKGVKAPKGEGKAAIDTYL